MIYDPAIRLHTIKQSQQEHRDIAAAHRLSRSATAGDLPARPTRRLPRLRRPAMPSLALRRHLTTP